MLNPTEDFFFNGYTTFSLKDSPVREKLLNSIKKAKEKDFDQEKFTWRTKYPGTEDFRESIFDYDSCFIDILFDNNIPELIKECTNYKRVTLAHIQLRKSYPGNSYMDWHRDNYTDKGKQVGMFPPSFKIIFYPLYPEGQDCLKVIPGTHVRFFEDRKVDSEINSKFPHKTIESSNHNMTFFDTSIWHSAINGNDPSGSLRLIYGFSSEKQYLENFSSQPVHERINGYYEQKLQEKN
jgi:hypothetical protein